MTTIGRLAIGLAAFAIIVLGSGNRLLQPPLAFAENANKCGCYGDSVGGCFCNKNAKCGCPGECEPKHCEAQRQKQFDREIQIETRKAAEAARKREPRKAADSVATDSPASQGAGRDKRTGGAAGAMTTSQKSQLSRLLTLYLAEHPGARDQNLGNVLSDLKRDERPGDQP